MITPKINALVATGAITSQSWLPEIGRVSEVAETWLPILGCMWLLIQITGYFLKKRKPKS